MLPRPRRFPSGTLSGLALATAVVTAVLVPGNTAHASSSTHTWSMNEANDAGTMIDSGSPTQTDGSWTNIQAGVPGFAGTAYRFNGTSRVTVADNASLDPGSDTFTATVHVRFTDMPTDAVGGDFDLIRKGLGTTKGGYWKIEIYPNSAHTKALGLCQMKGSSNSVKISGSPRSLNDGQWHTISCTKTSSDVTLAVDGTNYRKTVALGSIANADALTLGSKNIGGDWYSGDMDEVTFNIGSISAPPPTISGFSPTSGPVGSSVSITGTNLATASAVTFTSNLSASFVVNSDTQVTATVPSGAETGPISVTTGGGTATSADSFTVTTSSGGTISEVQKSFGSAGSTSVSATLGSTPATDDVLVAVAVNASSTSVTFSTPAGWSIGRSEPGAAVFYRVAGASESRTVAVSPSDGQVYTLRLWIFELAGADTTNPFDQSGRGTFSSSTSTTISTDGATAQGDEWAVAAIGWKGQVTSGSQSFDGGFTAFTGNTRGYAATEVLSIAGAVSTTASWATSVGGIKIIGTFRAAGG
jgi:hypothetical protein